jgi:hypothetical protein
MKDFNRYQREKAEKSGGADRATATPEETAEEASKEASKEAGEEMSEEQKEAAELIERAFSVYNGKSDTSVLAEILKQAEASKRAGKLTNEEIDTFFAQFSPLLSEAQREKLRSVLARLKKV